MAFHNSYGGQKSKRHRKGYVSSGSSRGEFVSCLHHLLETVSIPGLVVHITLTSTSVFILSSLICPCCLLLIRILNITLNPPRKFGIISQSQDAYFPDLKLITSAKSLLSCKITYLWVPGTKICVSMKTHNSVYHRILKNI